MATQTINGAFRSGPAIGDDFAGAAPTVACAWTEGATQIDTIGSGPSLGGPWTIYGWAIKFGLVLLPETGPGFGRLGRIIGGLIPGSQQTTGSPTILENYVRPALPLPEDTSMLSVIWDPEQGSPPYLVGGAGAPPASAVMGSMALPQPLNLAAGEQISIGLWLMPSLLSEGALPFLINPTWAIVISDAAAPPQGPWT